MIREADVVVVGSGAAGLMAALRARALGLEVVVIEKTTQFGGTTATSGGIFWVPNHGVSGFQDDPKEALEYLRALTGGQVSEDRLRAFIDNGPRMVRFIESLGVQLERLPTSDYYPEVPGSRPGRSLAVPGMDASDLGEAFFKMREPNRMRVLFGRYVLDRPQSYKLAGRTKGWQWTALRLVARYWLDFGQRLKSRRDSRVTGGDALIGLLSRELARQGVPLLLDCPLHQIVVEDGRVTGVMVGERAIRPRKGVILAAGGIEQDQALRDAHLPVPTSTEASLSPAGANSGDVLRAAQAIGAAAEFLDALWWMPVVQLPSRAGEVATHAMAFDQRNPNSIMVNRLGDRFVNENCSYDRFGIAMIADQQRSGANAPCWMIFDATYRERYSCGGLLPTVVMPDWRVPRDWWDRYLFRAKTIPALAAKIDLRPEKLTATVARFNQFATTGVDEDFHRGESIFDQARADRRVSPNGCLGALDEAPFYAVRIDLGDIGSKGGLKCDGNARVLDTAGQPIAGLYAAGNCAASPFANAYPGAGGTIGPALTFGFIAAEAIAREPSSA